MTTYFTPSLFTIFRAELIKSRHSAALLLALFMPCIVGVPTLILSFIGASEIVPTLLWNYWYSMLMPVEICLISASCAMWEKKTHMHSIVSLPSGRSRIFLAKLMYVWLLTFTSNLIIAAFSIATLFFGSQAPNILTSLISALVLTIMSAWIAPLSLALTTLTNTLIGIAVPAFVHIALYITLWSSPLWWTLPSSALGRVMQPLIGVLPSGETVEAGYGVPLWQILTSVGITVCFTALLTALFCTSYARKEVR